MHPHKQKITNICINIMHPCVFIVFSLLLLNIAQLVAMVGGRGDDIGVLKKCLDNERHALLAFKTHLEDPDGCLSTWTTEEDCCEWGGVRCNGQTGHVTMLEFVPCNLKGQISNSLLNISYLNHLDFSANSFHGIIPKSIHFLTKLRYLALRFNNLNGTIPRSIGSLTKLSHLDLSSNNLNGTIPRSIGSLTKLSHLDLSSNNLNGTIPRSIGSLTKLRYLDLMFNNLNGTIPRSIGSLTKLSHLDLSSNNLSGTIPRSIGSLTELRYLYLSNNSLYGTIPPEFGNLISLRELSLRFVGSCGVENLEWLSPLSNLEDLDMDGISLAKVNYWVDVILSLRKLSYLSLEGCELSQVIYPHSSFLNSSSSIDTLYLGNNNLTSSMYGWLFPLTSNKLRKLHLAYNKLEGIPTYLGNLCSLESLTFHDNSAVVKFPDFVNNLSGCTANTLQMLYASRSQFIGSISDEIQKFSSLVILDLSKNKLDGTVSEKLWELPSLVLLDLSSNHIRGSISGNIGKSKLVQIYLSENSFGGVSFTDHMSNLSYVTFIDLSSCKLGPRFPKWIQTLKNLSGLNIANSNISDSTPLEFWNTWPSQLEYLNFSSNNFSGKIPDLSSNFDYNSVIDLSFNSFYGPIPNVSSNVTSLNLSRNNFNGGISFLCLMEDAFLKYLDLSDNFLSGQLPDCLWHFKELMVLNLGNNLLSGKLPNSIESLIKLEALYLNKNDFSGELALSLQNCTSLSSLILGDNAFYGNVPVWIGENLRGLYVLILSSNKFFGTIPLQLCQLASLRILDLSFNHLHGTIPSCFNNLTSMVQQGFLPPQNYHNFFPSYDKYVSKIYAPGIVEWVYVDRALIEWQGSQREFSKNNLVLLKSIDLSSNNLTGQIPYELANLYELVNLNLSKNVLLGEIPRDIGQMKKLLALDISRNNLSGGIPSSMTQMSSLCYLDVSWNDLSGRIPSSTQLQSFEASRYEGNSGLCGLPLTKKCLGDEEVVVGKRKGDEEDIDELERWLYIGGATGFATGFWVACGTLLVNRRGRQAFFHFYDSFKDWVYVKVVVFIANLHRFRHT